MSAIFEKEAVVPASDHAQRSCRGHILVVDDHPDMRAYLTEVLEASGFDVTLLDDGAAALDASRARPPDAIVSDVVMPGIDGFELIERLRRDERTALIPVLLLSGQATEEARIAGISAGAHDFLVKPVRRRELVARLDGAITVSRLRAEALRREQAELALLLAMAPDGVLVLGAGGDVVRANARAAELFGYPLSEMAHLHVSQLLACSEPVSAEQAQDASWPPTSTLLTPIQECRGKRGDGGVFVAEIVIGPLAHFMHQPCKVAIVRDITERKRLESERAVQARRFRALSHRLVEVQETERRLLSTELHDRTSPALAAIRINLKLLEDAFAGSDMPDAAALVEDTRALVEETTASIRDISSNLRPTALDDGGLVAAARAYSQQFTRRTGVEVLLAVSGDPDTASPSTRTAMFRIVQEALTNCAKHAAARRVRVRLEAEGGRYALAIEDDGGGFRPEAGRTAGLGLLTMRERAEFAGGAFALRSAPGEGTRIEAVFAAGPDAGSGASLPPAVD